MIILVRIRKIPTMFRVKIDSICAGSSLRIGCVQKLDWMDHIDVHVIHPHTCANLHDTSRIRRCNRVGAAFDLQHGKLCEANFFERYTRTIRLYLPTN